MTGCIGYAEARQAAIMRQRQGVLAQRQADLPSQFIPAPIGGINARDSIDGMAPTDAVTLKNWYPEAGKVSLRKGFTSHATGVGSGAVETVIEFRSGTTSKLLAASETAIYDATSTGAASSLATSLSNGRWQGAMMNGVLALANGEDALRQYDGANVSTLSITGPTSASVIGVTVHGNRSWFWEVNSASVWYSALGALAGTCTELDLAQIGQTGGALYNVVSWTKDGGAGPDDFICFVMSTGEVLVYAFDPGFNLAIVGRFMIGAPVSRRGAIKLAGDVLILTKDGFQSLAGALAQSRLNLPTASASGLPTNLSDKISRLALQQIANTGSSFGWQPLHFPGGRYLLVNYPTGSASKFEQFVMNLDTGAWCQFDGMNASSWTLFNDHPYFGGAGGVVYRAHTGTADAGANIRGAARTAYTYLGDRGRRKTVKMIHPVLQVDGRININVGVKADFSNDGPTPIAEFGGGAAGSEWDESPWDAGIWGGTQAPRGKWLPRACNGFAVATDMTARTNTQMVSWFSTGYAYQIGGVM